jgi:Helicase conserved C-terminal domain
MTERARLIEWIRGELVGPSRPITQVTVIEFDDKIFVDSQPLRSGPMAWVPTPSAEPEEVLYFERETPHRKYGAGVLHPASQATPAAFDQAAQASDTLGIEPESDDLAEDAVDEEPESGSGDAAETAETSDDFEVTSPDIRHPSTVGISFCVRVEKGGRVVVRFPQKKNLLWQDEADIPEFPVNGRYELCTRRWTSGEGLPREAGMWRRVPAVLPNTNLSFDGADLETGHILVRDIIMPPGSPIALRLELYPRRMHASEEVWLLTVVLRNASRPTSGNGSKEATLYQTCFEVLTVDAYFEKYPESQRPFSQLDDEEKSLSLLYRESGTWGIGHGCAAGWDSEPGETPTVLYADVMPAVQTPSMTPDIRDTAGNRIRLSMRELANLPDDSETGVWHTLNKVSAEYGAWIDQRRAEAQALPDHLRPVADRHLTAAESCLNRINRGVDILRTNQQARSAFKLANLAMLLQQIASRQLARRPLYFDQPAGLVRPSGTFNSPWRVYIQRGEEPDSGHWRAFQIAFMLMSIEGMTDDRSVDREIVDLIWFPTGGGKTEAYLAVMAFYMFHERLLMAHGTGTMARDGTNVLMRYTLRMLTTQQFQRAASLICAMEFLRRSAGQHDIPELGGGRFSLGLWIGGSGSPNSITQARIDVGAFRSERLSGNPLVITECPWCRAEIGKFEGIKPKSIPEKRWKGLCVKGINDHPSEGPLLLCADASCPFGSERWQDWLPVEVIDERIYRNPPSLVIATADKFAMVAYRPEAGALFGRSFADDRPRQTTLPPGLIVQDELHLISGPLGTMYGLYEGIFERLCSRPVGNNWIKPKIIASTATIRGAADQVTALYARSKTQLFPSPGLLMGDSFFGTYARKEDGSLRPGRLYLGVHANDYGSILTTQVRAFSSALFRPQSFNPQDRDAWWSLLVFYNSIRELGGAKTLFDSDIRSRLKFMFNRENVMPQHRRNLRIVEELTSRLSQAEIVGMLDRLSTAYSDQDNEALDVCLASNIIEVGVDIERLSLMGVVGQPKTTAQYIQVTGRVGRRWWERPGLILTIYNPSKSRDRSHFEQFHSYHRRLYERVEPTSATPFALSAIRRALPGALIAWARQYSNAFVQNYSAYESAIDFACQLLRERCVNVQSQEDRERSLEELDRVRQEVESKWQQNPVEWEEFPPSTIAEYLMLWPGQFATIVQKQRGIVVPSSMRQVDGSAELTITQAYQ